MRNILIIGSYLKSYDTNKGDEAIMASSVKILRQFFTDVIFTMFNHCDEIIFNKYDLNRSKWQMPRTGVVRIGLFLSLFLQYNLKNMFKKFGLSPNNAILFNNNILTEYENADLIIHMTMDAYSEKAGILAMIDKSIEILLCALIEKPIVMFAQSIGPFHSWPYTSLAKLTLNKTSLILLRESTSHENLLRLQINTPIHVTACPAFLFKPVSKERVKEILLTEQVQFDHIRVPLIGISLNSDMGQVTLQKNNAFKLFILFVGRLLRFSFPDNIFHFLYRIVPFDKKMNKDRQQQIVELVNNLAERLGGTIILVPHDYLVAALHDDKLYTMQVFSQIECKENFRLIRGSYSAEEVKGIIGQCDMFIGEKLHACIAAMSQYIPTIGIAYSSKFLGVFRQLGQEEYLCSELSKEQIITRMEQAWINKKNIHNSLKIRMNEIRQLVLLNGKLTKQIIECD